MLGRPLVVFFAVLAALQGADTPLAGPVTGFVFDAQSKAIRQMLGIPGAATVGEAVVSAVDLGSVAPDGSAVLALQGSQLFWYAALRGGAPAATVVNGAIGAVDRFAWSPDASGAAVYSSNNDQAQIINSAAAGAAIDLSGLPGPVAALAFDGQRIIVGVAGGVFTVDRQGAMKPVAKAAAPSAIALAGADLYFADSQAHQIWLVQQYATQPAAHLFTQESSLRVPAGLQLSSDGLRLLVAYAGSRELLIYDVASRSALRTLALDIAPAGLERFGSASAFLLNARGPGPLYVFSDRGGEDSAVSFVPMAPLDNWRRAVRVRTN